MAGARRGAILGAVLGAAIAAACSQTPKVKPSPLPPGYHEAPCTVPAPRVDTQGKDLDERLAVVEGKPMTRRRLVRETGGRTKDMDEADLERQVRRRLKEWAREELFVHEATRAGIQIKEQLLDDFVAQQAKAMEKEASKSEGRPVAIEEVLHDRGITYDEFREGVRRAGLRRVYLLKVLEGVSGARPQVDMEVSPAEIRRIYRDHPGEFDVKRGVRIAVFEFPLSPRFTKDGNVPFQEAEAEARRTARAAADAFMAGEEPTAIARRFELGKAEWSEVPRFMGEDDELLRKAFGDVAVAWLFDPKRRVHDAAVQNDPAGPKVLGIVEVRAAESLDWDAASEQISKQVRRARELRVEANLVINMLSGRSVVWPQDLADEIVADMRGVLAEIEKDPVLGAARFQ